jgi:uncharacterized protein (DUF1330 family)
MPVYWIARAKIIDQESYKKYADKAGGIIESFGGKFLTRGGNFKIMEGTDNFTRFVIAEFPNMELAEECFNSDAYKNAAKNRRNGSGEVEIVFVEAN